MEVKQFKLKEDHIPTGLVKDQLVYQFTGYTYGLCSDDTRHTGVEHTAVTRDSAGGYPFCTVPVHKLEEVQS